MFLLTTLRHATDVMIPNNINYKLYLRKVSPQNVFKIYLGNMSGTPFLDTYSLKRICKTLS